ncbi:MAG: type II toxin-antitoxin system RelE/ParE family toxin [Chitinophagales bacterium]
MKFSYKISTLAKDDLENIWIYTYENWSLEQADKYYESIINEFESICQHTKIGKSIEEIKSQHRIHPFQSHLIIYKIKHDKIWIDRILHKQMDIETRLEE